jgi:hypothetical protein
MNQVQTDYLRIDMGQNEFGQDYHIDLKIEQRRSERGFFRLYKLSHNGTGEYEVCDLQVVLTRGENGEYHLQDDITDKAIALISLKYSATKLASSEDPAEINLNLPNDYYGTSLFQVYDNQVIYLFRDWAENMKLRYNVLVTIEVPALPNLSELRRREEGFRRRF